MSVDLTTQQIIEIGKRMELERKQKEEIFTKSYELSKDKDEIRNNTNPALPQIIAFERWLVDEYQPVQGRINIANPMGIRPEDTETC